MKAVLLKSYGGVDKLEYGDVPDPKPAAGEVLVRVRSISINPIDYKLRSGVMKDAMPLDLPAILGHDIAGEVVALGEGVTTFKQGDRVMGVVNNAYAELVAAKADVLSLVPDGMKLEDAAAYPLVLITGAQLMELGVKPQAGQTILVTGAVGGVGRVAVHVAKQHGANVIAGVRGSQREQARALGAEQVIAIDDDAEIAKLGEVDAIADTVDRDTIGKLLPHIRKGGRLGTVLGKPQAAEGKPIEVGEVYAKPNPPQLRALAEALVSGKLSLPISARYPLSEVRAAHQAAEKGADGKVLLIP